MDFSSNSKPMVTSFGEALIDMIAQPDGAFMPVPGGSPMNLAVSLGRQGIKSSIVTPISKDEFGKRLITHLQDSNVDTSRVTFTNAPTTLAIATMDILGEASFSFYINGCSQGELGYEVLSEQVGDVDFLFIGGSFALAIDHMTKSFDELLDYVHTSSISKTVFFDPNVRPAVIGDKWNLVKDNFERWVSHSTVVKASDVDLNLLYPGEPYTQIAKDWVENYGVKLAIVTLADKGAYGCTSKVSMHLPARSIAVVDTLGAGDAFSAGIIKWLIDNDKYHPDQIEVLEEIDLEHALDAAIELSGDTCRREGSDPPFLIDQAS